MSLMSLKLNTVQDIRNELKRKLKAEEFTIDKSGVKTVELIGVSFIVDEHSIIGKVNMQYVEKELNWYNSQSRNVWDIEGTVPKIWQMVSDRNGNINSNYGWAIYSEENGYQYKNVLRKLKKDPNSRQAIMIYNRPSMHTDYNKDGMSDFMCCQNVKYFIRDDKLISVVDFRSNDARFGFLNDLHWMLHVQEKLFMDLREAYPSLQMGHIVWNAGSLHVYERDFDLLAESK